LIRLSYTLCTYFFILLLLLLLLFVSVRVTCVPNTTLGVNDLCGCASARTWTARTIRTGRRRGPYAHTIAHTQLKPKRNNSRPRRCSAINFRVPIKSWRARPVEIHAYTVHNEYVYNVRACIYVTMHRYVKYTQYCICV